MIAIVVSSSISGTFQSALTAKQICDYDGIHVVDSRCGTVGIQFLVEEALRMAARGADVEQIIARLDSLKERIHIYAGVETLKYLYLGGRLSRAEAGIGTLAGIRPLLSLRDGKLEAFAKCMGTKKAMKKLVDTINSVEKDPAFDVRFIYTYDKTNCETLMGLLPELIGSEPIEIGPSISVHSGPGVYGAVFVAAE
jgi:DegV family protein with EDD domain